MSESRTPWLTDAEIMAQRARSTMTKVVRRRKGAQSDPRIYDAYGRPKASRISATEYAPPSMLWTKRDRMKYAANGPLGDRDFDWHASRRKRPSIRYHLRNGDVIRVQ